MLQQHHNRRSNRTAAGGATVPPQYRRNTAAGGATVPPQEGQQPHKGKPSGNITTAGETVAPRDEPADRHNSSSAAAGEAPMKTAQRQQK